MIQPVPLLNCPHNIPQFYQQLRSERTWEEARNPYYNKLSTDPGVKRECVKHLKCAQRRAASHSTRLGAVKGILESDVASEFLLGILIERMYLDPRYSIREYARRMLIRKNHELAVKLDAFEDRV